MCCLKITLVNKFLSMSISNNNDSFTYPEGKKTKRIFKIIVVGDSNVGKTCLTYRFCEGKFPARTEATIGVDFRERSIKIGSEDLKLQLWDTAGQERFRRSMLPHYYRNVHAVVFVYDMTKVSSFNSLPVWLQECEEHYLAGDVPRLLIGNKCDEPAQAVSTQAAQRFADSHAMPLFETSAKDDSRANHVESIFLTLAHKLANRRPMMPRAYSAEEERRQAGPGQGGGFSLHGGDGGPRGREDAGEYDEDPCLC